MPLTPAFTHAASKVLPRPKSGNASNGRHLPCNLQHVPKAVIVKAAHGCEIVGAGVRMSRLQLLNYATQRQTSGTDEVPSLHQSLGFLTFRVLLPLVGSVATPKSLLLF